MNFVNIQLDIYGLIILCLLYVNNFSKKNDIGKKLFNYLMYSIMTAIIVDVVIRCVDNKHFLYAHVFSFIIASIYHVLLPFCGFCSVVYCDYKLNGSQAKLRKNIPIYSMPVILALICVPLNIKYRFLFDITPDNRYFSGYSSWLTVFFTFIYLFHSITTALRAASKTEILSEKKECYQIAGFIIPAFIGGILQSDFYGISAGWAGAVLSILIIYINIQNGQISTDPLTGIYNRRLFYRYLELKTSNISPDSKIFAFMIDMDDFKGINDTYGHSAGDDALICTANILKSACDVQSDYLARMGGDEFCIACVRNKGVEMPDIYNQIRNEIDKFNEISNKPFKLALSIGVAIFGEDDTSTVDELMNKADKKLYEEKLSKKVLRNNKV